MHFQSDHVRNKLIINLLPVSKGGGLQNALSFIKTLLQYREIVHDSCVIVSENSLLSKLCLENGVNTLVISSGNYHRLKFELSIRNIFNKDQICFTLFGPPLLTSKNYLLNINGVAYSNLYYPEIKFWSYLSTHKLMIKNIIDIYRKNMLKKSDYWIFETEILRTRAVNIYKYPQERTSVVKMAPSIIISKDNLDIEKANKYDGLLPNKNRILYLSGAHPNKRIHLLIEIAKQMVRIGYEDFCFVTTMDPKSSYANYVQSQFIKFNLDGKYFNVGPINQFDVSNLISVCDSMINISLLESFSNNFIEAWKIQKPLIVTESDWAKGSCGDAALYIDPTNYKKAAEQMIELFENKNQQKELIEKGERMLVNYNTPESKFQEYMKIIQKIKELGHLDVQTRNKIIL